MAHVSTGRFLILQEKKKKKPSSDVCWSLRWKTRRNAALDNKSVQPLLPNCRSAELSNGNQKHRLFSVQGGTVVWSGRKFKGCLCRTGNSLGILAGCIHTCTHAFMHCHPWPVYYIPCCLMSCSCQLWSKPSHPAFRTSTFVLLKRFKHLNRPDAICKHIFFISAAYVKISLRLNWINKTGKAFPPGRPH